MNWNRFILTLAGALLLTASLERFLLAATAAPVISSLQPPAFSLSLPDPALGLPLRYTVLAVGAIELLVALVCLLGRNAFHQFAWLAWLSTDYLAFRICLFYINVHPQNTCIGTLTDPLHLSHSPTGLVTSLIPTCFLVYSFSALIYLWHRSHSALRTPHSALDPSSVVSHQSSVLSHQFLRTSCPLCSGHIEFPAHGLGQTIACPHCRAPLILKAPF